MSIVSMRAAYSDEKPRDCKMDKAAMELQGCQRNTRAIVVDVIRNLIARSGRCADRQAACGSGMAGSFDEILVWANLAM